MGIVRAALLAMMLVVIGVPLLHTLVVREDPLGPLASPRLGKVVFPLEPQWTWAGWISGDFQRSADRWFSNVVEPRGWVIQLTNQLLYAVFARSYMGDRTIVIGREGELYQRLFIEAYCAGGDAGDQVAVAASAAGVGELNARLTRAGTTLLVLITPNKAAVLPERLPAGMCRPVGDPATRRERFVSALRAAGVTVIDGHAVVMAMKAEDPLPPFPRGSIHWSRLAGARVAALVLREAGRQGGVDLGGLEMRNVRWDARPEQSDRDVADLLTLFAPPLGYRVGEAEIVCRPTPLGRTRAFVTIGTSFLYQMLAPITDCRLFRQVENYFYYDVLHDRWPGPLRQRPTASTLRWRHTLAATDVVVLETGEHLIGHAPHFDRFVRDALAALR